MWNLLHFRTVFFHAFLNISSFEDFIAIVAESDTFPDSFVSAIELETILEYQHYDLFFNITESKAARWPRKLIIGEVALNAVTEEEKLKTWKFLQKLQGLEELQVLRMQFPIGVHSQNYSIGQSLILTSL